MGWGGARPGAGRKKGVRNARTRAILDDLKRRFPDYTPGELLVSMVGDETLPIELRADAEKALLPYFIPRPKPIELHPERAVEHERQLTEARVAGGINVHDIRLTAGLAGRLKTARQRIIEGPQPHDETPAPAPVIEATPAIPESPPVEAAPEPAEPAEEADGSTPPPPPSYQPLVPSWAGSGAAWRPRIGADLSAGSAVSDYDPIED